MLTSLSTGCWQMLNDRHLLRHDDLLPLQPDYRRYAVDGGHMRRVTSDTHGDGVVT
jgi:hypothetical protein